MKMTIKIHSMDDLISLISLARMVEAKEIKTEAAPQPRKDIKQVVEKAQQIMDESRKERVKAFLNSSIESLGLWPPATKSLIDNGIHTIHDLVHYRREELMKMNNVGHYTIRQIKHLLAHYNFKLRD